MSLKTYAIPFALLCKLCGGPDGDDGSEYPDGDWEPVDGAVSDAGSDASLASDAGASDASHADAAIDADHSAVDATAADATTADAATADARPLADASVRRGPCEGPPALYRGSECEEVQAGVHPYKPRFELWSDGALKERHVFLPHRAEIDATDANAWVYPVGTRLYKTFSKNGMKLETRVIEKVTQGRGVDTWRFQAYAWNAEQNAVELVEEIGRQNVLGTAHDIPSLAQCRSCHSNAGQDGVNGFSAIQLNHSGEGVTLEELLEDGTLKAPDGDALRELAEVPGTPEAQAGLGVLHANCGHCHGGPAPKAQLTLRLSVGQLNLLTTDLYRSVVGAPLMVWKDKTRADGVPYTLRADPGDATLSAIVARMSTRGSKDQMPPMGTEQLDHVGLKAVTTMIDTLPDRMGL